MAEIGSLDKNLEINFKGVFLLIERFLVFF